MSLIHHLVNNTCLIAIIFSVSIFTRHMPPPSRIPRSSPPSLTALTVSCRLVHGIVFIQKMRDFDVAQVGMLFRDKMYHKKFKNQVNLIFDNHATETQKSWKI
jgi:hypothetical protein